MKTLDFRKRSRGLAIVTMLSLGTFVALLALAMIGRVDTFLQRGKRDTVKGQARLTAFAGLSKALEELRADPTWTGATDFTPPGVPGRVSVSIQLNTTATPMPSPDGVSIPPRMILVKAEGDNGEAYQATVFGLLDLSFSTRYSRAATVSGDLSVVGATIDAYDSQGEPAGTSHREAGKASVGAIGRTRVVEGPGDQEGVIDGEVSNHQDPGVGLFVDALSSAGGYDQLADPLNPYRNLPSSPTWGSPGAIIQVTGSDHLTLSQGEYSGLVVKDGGLVTLSEDGDYLFTQGLQLSQDARIEVAPGVKARILLGGTSAFLDGAKVNWRGRPEQVEIVSYAPFRVDGDYLTLEGIDVSGQLYIAPNSDVVAAVSGDDLVGVIEGELWGAFNGLELKVTTGALHYATNLGVVGMTVGGGAYVAIWDGKG